MSNSGRMTRRQRIYVTVGVGLTFLGIAMMFLFPYLVILWYAGPTGEGWGAEAMGRSNRVRLCNSISLKLFFGGLALTIVSFLYTFGTTAAWFIREGEIKSDEHI